MTFNVNVMTTHLTVSPASEAIDLLQPLLDRMVYEDEYALEGNELKVCGYVYDEEHDILYLHKGVDLTYLQRLLINVKITLYEPDPYDEMEFEFEEIIAPRDELQYDIIDFFRGVNGHANALPKHQLLLVAGTGTGKTFTSSYGACLLKMKTLIIVHRGSLIQQWTKTLMNMHGVPSKCIRVLSTDDLLQASTNTHKFNNDIYILTHATFRSALKRINDFNRASNMFKNLKIGLKIIDECHLEFRNIILIDFLSNIHKNFYLSATPSRSNKDEQSIYKYVFSDTLFYRRSEMSKDPTIPQKWVSYTTIFINTHLNPNVYHYKVNRGKSMNAVSYGKFVIKHDKNKKHFKVCRDLLRNLFLEDDHSKIIVFMPLIELTEELQYFLSTQLSYDETFPYDLTIRTMTSKNTKSDNERNKKADVIITTIQSCGTGTDLPGLTGVISCSPFASAVTAQQVFGRLRYCGKLCHYYDVIDKSVPADNYFWKARKKVFDRLALEVHYQEYEPDD